jgi:hypothetical protein
VSSSRAVKPVPSVQAPELVHCQNTQEELALQVARQVSQSAMLDSDVASAIPNIFFCPTGQVVRVAGIGAYYLMKIASL